MADGFIHINDVFATFQGEGFHAGRRALFVRMPFCDLACPWCDTQFDKFKPWDKDDFRDFAQREENRFAVITGGEPTMHKHTPVVIDILKSLGFYIAIESNGHFPIPAGIDFVTISPKAYTSAKHPEPFYVCEDAWAKCSEFKYVVEEGFNFDLLARHTKEDGKILSLSPEFNIFHQSLARIFDFIKEHPQWRISLQTHKFMNVP